MAAQQQPGPEADLALRAALRTTREYWKNPKVAVMAAFETVRAMCPASSSEEKYYDHQTPSGWGMLDHELAVIEANDVPAVLELIRAQPELLTHESAVEGLGPPLVYAVYLGHHEVIGALLKYRATVPPELRAPDEYEAMYDCSRQGTPMTTACKMGRLDTLRLLLGGMPDADINEVDNNGHTPFLAAAKNTRGPTEARLALLRFLVDNGADIHAVQASSLSQVETLDKEYDGELKDFDEPVTFRPRPGGHGNALALAMSCYDSDPLVLKFLVNTGVDVYQSRWEALDRVDQTGDNINDDANGRYQHHYYDRGVLSPMAIGANYWNATGVKSLLDLFPNDHFHLLASTDAIIVPEPRPLLRDPDDEIPVVLPPHALLLASTLYLNGFRRRKDHVAAVAAAVDVLRLITADEVIREATVNAPYRKNYTPLHLATKFDRIPVLLELIELGADLDVPRHDGQGLILALFSSIISLAPEGWQYDWAVDVDSSTDMMAVLGTLLKRYSPQGQDVDVDAKNKAVRLSLINEADANGNTPLHFAMHYRLARSTEALIAFGAQMGPANRVGMVPVAEPSGQEASN